MKRWLTLALAAALSLPIPAHAVKFRGAGGQGINTPTGEASFPLDWTASTNLIANYRGEDVAGTTDSATVRDGAQTLTVGGSATVGTSTKFEAAQALHFGATTDYFQNNSALLRPAGTDLSVGCAIRPTASTGWDFLYAWQSSKGYKCTRQGSGSSRHLQCQMEATTVTSSASLAENVWAHAGVELSGTTLQTYVNGVANGTPATISGALETASTQFFLNRNSGGTSTQASDMDDCFVFAGHLSSVGSYTSGEYWCRIDAIGWAGTGGECDPATDTTPGITSYKSCTADADCRSGAGKCSTGLTPNRCVGNYTGGCTLPACKAAVP